MLRKVFETKGEKEQRKFLKKEFLGFYSSPHVKRVIKSHSMRWAENVALSVEKHEGQRKPARPKDNVKTKSKET